MPKKKIYINKSNLFIALLILILSVICLLMSKYCNNVILNLTIFNFITPLSYCIGRTYIKKHTPLISHV